MTKERLPTYFLRLLLKISPQAAKPGRKASNTFINVDFNSTNFRKVPKKLA